MNRKQIIKTVSRKATAPKIVSVIIENQQLDDPNDKIVVFESDDGSSIKLRVGVFQNSFVEGILRAQQRIIDSSLSDPGKRTNIPKAPTVN